MARKQSGARVADGGAEEIFPALPDHRTAARTQKGAIPSIYLRGQRRGRVSLGIRSFFCAWPFYFPADRTAEPITTGRGRRDPHFGDSSSAHECSPRRRRASTDAEQEVPAVPADY